MARKKTTAKKTRTRGKNIDLTQINGLYEQAKGSFESRVEWVEAHSNLDRDRVLKALKVAKGALWYAENAPASARGRTSTLDTKFQDSDILTALNKNGSVAGAAKALKISSISLKSQLEKRKIVNIWRKVEE